MLSRVEAFQRNASEAEPDKGPSNTGISIALAFDVAWRTQEEQVACNLEDLRVSLRLEQRLIVYLVHGYGRPDEFDP